MLMVVVSERRDLKNEVNENDSLFIVLVCDGGVVWCLWLCDEHVVVVMMMVLVTWVKDEILMKDATEEGI